jgi:hypothetical protein
VANERSIVFTLPPIGRHSKRLATLVGVMWAVHVVLYFVVGRSLEALPTVRWASLIPMKVTGSWQLWRVLSYATLDMPNGIDGLWTVLMLWFFATPIEKVKGLRGILVPWMVGALGGAAVLLGLARLSLDYHMSPAMGLSPILSSALLVQWGFLFARERVSLFGLAEMDGRVLAGIFCGITALNALSSRAPIAMASLGAMAAVALWALASRAMDARGGGGGGGRKRSSSGTFTVIQGGKRDEKKWVN